ncbi:MAG: hypothetical protein K0S34_1567 [Bacillales bacterium]|jgi:hypothetical protein|nr:hypothetical protein [Bacillales bacterium]
MNKTITIIISLFVFLFFLPVESEAKSYTDTKFTNTNVKLKSYKVITSGNAVTESGESVLFVSLQGVPAKVAQIDINTMSAIKEFPLPYAKYNWAMEFDNKGVAYFGGTPDGHLYSYDYKSSEFKDFGRVLLGNDSAIYDLKLVGTELFFVTANGGSLYSYNLMTRSTIYYGAVSYGRTIAKALDYDSINNKLLIGTGSPAQLVSFDLTSRSFSPVTLDGYVNSSLFYNIKYIDGYFFVRTYPSKDILVIDSNTFEIVTSFKSDSIGVSDKLPNEDAVIFSYDKALYKYDYKSKELKNIGINIGPNVVAGFHIIHQSYLLMFLNNDGDFIKLDLSNNDYELGRLEVSKQEIDYHILTSVKDNSVVLGNGFLTGGIVSYDINTRNYNQLDGISQIESFFEKGDKLYLGVYPSARVYEYDTSKPWVGGDTQNPRELFRMEEYGQTRPTAIAGDVKLDEIYFGFYPESGIGGGSLVSYNSITGEKVVYENYVDNHGIASLKYFNGYIYGGTTIFANGKRAVDGAKFFRFKVGDPSSKEILVVPFMKRAMVTDIIEGYFNDLWGIADGYVFNYNPSTKSSKVVQILPATSGRFRNGTIVRGENGYIYGTVEGKFFRVNPLTYKSEILRTSNAYNIAKDKNGLIYFYDKANLWSYEPSKLEFNDLLKQVDNKLAASSKQKSVIEYSYRVKYSNANALKSSVKTLKANINATEKIILTLPEQKKSNYIQRNNSYKVLINRVNKYTSVYDLINSKYSHYKSNVSSKLERGIIDKNVISNYNKLDQDVLAIEKQILSVYRKNNQDYLNKSRLDLIRKIKRNTRSSINSEIFLNKFAESYKSGDKVAATMHLNKAIIETSKINYKKFKKIQEKKLKNAQALIKTMK